jgi:hypothetical protein
MPVPDRWGSDTVTPGGSCIGDVRVQIVALTHGNQVDGLEPRTPARSPKKAVSLLKKGRNEVQSPSSNCYEVDIVGESCICQIGSSAPPPADVSTCVASITKSSAAESRDRMADPQLIRTDSD